MSTEPEPGLAPEHVGPRHTRDEPIMMTVDGQEFRVRRRVGRPAAYDFDWLSGPHDYGFTSSGPVMTRAEMEEAIRAFLRDIDPVTGYLRE
ncbi:hypothetical protein [Micromonospora sp. RP3T]|uniref:hypothetical protein n=1 Tax=Micromonospora sp. RP3T TaxID=2135446 RepID=UPI003D743BB0